MNWTQADLDEYMARQSKGSAKEGVKFQPGSERKDKPIVPATPVKEITATGKFELNSKMNKLEAAYGNLLEARKRAGEVAAYWYEGMTLKLARDCRFTPDYLVMLSNGAIECHETKGFLREDSWIKLKVAAEMYPFQFYLIRREKGEWDIQKVDRK